jgi:CheY-like chemotaxis protein
LTLARSLVEMHGGTLTAHSEGSGRGSEFRLRLPLAVEAENARASSNDARRKDFSGHRVLIVDDNVDAANTMSLLLQTLGTNEVRVVSSGSEALQQSADWKPDIMLLDLQMPEMDGYEVARRVRGEAWGKDLLIVALTGWGAHDHKRRTREAGFDHHLTKPADRAALEAVLGRPADGPRQSA